MAFADDVRAFVPPGRGDHQFQLLLDALHDLRVQPVESDLRRTVAFLAARYRRRSLVIYFTDLAAELDANSIVASLGLLARRHLVFCVSLTDPDLIAMSQQFPEDSRQAYEKVVARRLLDERRRVVEQLERLGIATIEGSPRRSRPM